MAKKDFIDLEQIMNSAHRVGPRQKNEVTVSWAEVPGFSSWVSLT